MNQEEVAKRLSRFRTALGDKTNRPLAEAPPITFRTARGFGVFQDFSGGKTTEQLEIDATGIISEFMGLKDRTRAWLKSKRRDPNAVENFMKSDKSVAILHDLG